MQRCVALIVSFALAFCALAAPAAAQEQRRPPSSLSDFSLQPSETDEPEPDVQGPRAPGVAAPRLIGPESEDEDRPAETAAPAQQRPAPAADTADRTQSDRPAATAPAQADRTQSASTAEPEPAASDDRAETTPVSPDDFMLAPPDEAPSALAESDAAPSTSPAAADNGEGGWPVAWIALLATLIVAGLAVYVVRKPKRPAMEMPVEPERVQPRRPAEPAKRVASPPVPQPSARPEPAVPPPPAPQPEPRAPVGQPAPTAPAPQPQPAAPVAPPIAAKAAEEPEGPRARLEMDFQPLIAKFSENGLHLSFRILIRNIGDDPVSDIAIRMMIRSADQNDAVPPPEATPPSIERPTLEAQEQVAYEGELRLGKQGIRPIQSQGETIMVPIVDLLPRYWDDDGEMHELHATLLVGREKTPPEAKMAPFRIGEPGTRIGGLGCRMLKRDENGRVAA